MSGTNQQPSKGIGLRRVGAVALLGLAPAAVLIAWILSHNQFPTRLATHFGFSGRPDGFSAPGAFVLGFGVVVLVVAGLAILALALTRGRSQARLSVALPGWIAWLLAASAIDVMGVARGVSDPSTIRSGWLHTLSCLVIASLVALLLYALVPAGRSSLHQMPAVVPSYQLDAGQRATFIGRARSRTLLTLGVVVALLGALGILRFGMPSLVVVGVGLILGWTSELFVRVDDRGVTAHFGPFGWPRSHTPLSRIETAVAEEIEPLKRGGWGYRIGPRGTALVVRRGPGIVLARAGASDLAITVDGADQAAELINALLARNARS